MTLFTLLTPGWLPLMLASSFQTGAPAPAMTSPADSISVRVAIPPSPTDALPTSATLSIQLAKGASGSESGIPGFIVQLDVPAGLRLSGEPITGFEDQRSNQFLMEPWERVVTDEETEIGFIVESGFDPASTLGVNILGYVGIGSGADDSGRKEAFLRRRFELKIEHGAVGQLVDASDSSWGPAGDWPAGERPLAVGDRAPGFTGPRLNMDAGTPFLEGSFDLPLGSGPLVITTYRGHW